MLLSTQIRDLIAKYTSGKSSVDEFRSGFVCLYRQARGADQDTAALAGKVEDYYADFFGSEIDEKQLVAKLVSLLPFVRVEQTEPLVAWYIDSGAPASNPISLAVPFSASGSFLDNLNKPTITPMVNSKA